MSQELIYTSSPKGLKLGARGFCTVASTAGISKNLADRLESLSGYRHVYPPGSPGAHLNPVNFSYLRFVLGGQSYYVLSRIADSGLDYTQRTNKLAHHIALQQKELPSAGPAWLERQPSLFATTWNREPQQLPTDGRPIPQGSSVVNVCNAWKMTTGDAGWAGVLANHLVSHTSSEAYLVFKPGTDLLELFAEAQSLLSVEQRWEATFSTYFTTLPPGIGCRWRGVLDGSPEATRARRTSGPLVIDLTGPLGRAPELPLVVAARFGCEPIPNVVPRLAANLDVRSGALGIPESAAEIYRLPEQATVVVPQPSAVNLPPKLPVSGHAESAFRPKRRRRLAILCMLVIAMSLGATISAAVLHYFHNPSIEMNSIARKSVAKQGEQPVEKPLTEQVGAPDSKKGQPDTTASPNPNLVEGAPSPKTVVKAPANANHNDADYGEKLVPNQSRSVTPNAPPQFDSAKSPGVPVSTRVPESKELKAAKSLADDIFDDLKSDIRLAEIPAPNVTVAGDKWREPIEIGGFPILDSPVRLLLIGVDDEVLFRGKFDGGRAGLNINGADLAELQIRGEPASLNFKWLPPAQASPRDQIEKIRTAVLVLTVPTNSDGDRSKAILLSPVQRDKPLKLSKSLDPASLPLPTGLSLTKATLKCRFQGMPGLNDSVQQLSPLNSENSISSAFGPDASLSLKVSYADKNEKRSLLFEVEGADSQGRKYPLAQLLKSLERRRRDILIDAIVEYVKETPTKWASWEVAGVPMGRVTNAIVAGQTKVTTSPNFDLDAEKRFRGKIKHERTTLSSLREAEEKSRSIADCPRSIALSAHEKEYPHLYDWSSIDDVIAVRVEANLQLVRHLHVPNLSNDLDVVLMENGAL